MKRTGILYRKATLLASLCLTILIVAQGAGRAGAVSGVSLALGGERVKHASPAAADFNGNGYLEIVVGTYDGRLIIVRTTNGSSWTVADSVQVANALNGKLPAGEHQAAGRIESAIAIGDVDADGRLEIVVTTGGFPDASNPGTNKHGGVIVYEVDNNLNLSVKPGWPTLALDAGGQGPGGSIPDGIRDGFWSSPALGDLTGDGKLEIVALGLDRQIYAWRHDGTAVPGWPVSRSNGDPILRGGWSSPALADIDGDGLVEVIVGTDSPPWNGDDGSGPFPPAYDNPDYTKATVWALNGDSSLVPGWPVITTQQVQSSPAVGDIDGDGDLEIVVGTGQGIAGTGGYKVYAWHHDGTAVAGWPVTTDGVMRASPALADLNGDGVLDVILGCGAPSDSACKKIYAWNGSGAALPGFPINTTYTNAYDPVVADIDNDGKPEILLGSNFREYLFVYEHNGAYSGDTSRTQQPGGNNGGFLNTPLIADVDNDGLLETVAAGAYSGQAGLYIWNETGVDSFAATPWPTFQQNMARTGLFNAPRLAVQNELRIYHQQGAGNTAVAALPVRNDGGGSFDYSVTEAIAALTVDNPTGTVSTVTGLNLSINTSSFAVGQWHTLGTLQISGERDGQAVAGSPKSVTVRLYVGDISRIYLPLTQR